MHPFAPYGTCITNILVHPSSSSATGVNRIILIYEYMNRYLQRKQPKHIKIEEFLYGNMHIAVMRKICVERISHVVTRFGLERGRPQVEVNRILSRRMLRKLLSPNAIAKRDGAFRDMQLLLLI